MRRLLLLSMLGCLMATAEPPLEEMLREAVHSADDQRILAAVQSLGRHQTANLVLRREAIRLGEEIERWITAPKLDYFGRQVLNNNTYDFGVSPESLLYPIAEYYFARMHVWVTLEYGGLWSDPVKKRVRFDEIRPVFERLRTQYPENQLVRMYLGEPVSPATAHTVTPDVLLEMPLPVEPADAPPAWALAQREALERLANVITWWIDHRMQEDGQYGGGWGDDCEMWRWWAPVLIGFADPKISAAQEHFSRALLSQPHMKDGYTANVYDVEHTSEDSSDVLTPMMHLQPGEGEWLGRTMRLVELFATLWTGKNERGQLQFKSTYFSVDKVDLSPARACDTVYHPRAVQPALLHWQRTGDPQLTALFTEWMDTWVDAAAREERGKPAGILPSAIHWPDGAVGGVGEHWWDPENHDNDPLYVFPSAMGQMLSTLLQTYAITGDERYLQPIRTMAQVRLDYLQNPPEGDPAPGSRMWCAQRLGSVGSVAAKYRLLTGNTDLDAFLESDPAPYIDYRVNGEMGRLTEALQDSAEALRTNFWGYTSEVRYTDRVLRFPALFAENGMFPEAITGIKVPDTDLLYSSVTGDPGSVQYFPMNAVRWHLSPRGFAALVKDATAIRFEAEVYCFEERDNLALELLRLKPGKYSLRLQRAGEHAEQFHEQHFERDASSMIVELPVPTGTLLKLVVEPQT